MSNINGRLYGFSKGVLKNIAIFGGSFSAADVADATSIEAALKTASLLPMSDNGKLIWLPESQNLEDKSESDKTGSLNQGFTMTLVEGKPIFEIKVFADSAFAVKFRGYNGKNVRILEYTDNRKLWGTKSGSSMIGYEAKLKFNGQRSATGQNVEEGVVTFTASIISTNEYYDAPVGVDMADVDLSVIQVQNDAVLSYISNATNVFEIAITIPNGLFAGGINVLDYYSAEIDQSLLVAYTGAKFNTPLTITSAAYNASTGGVTVTFDTTMYTALPAAAKIKLDLAAPSVLDAAGVTSIEGVAVVLTKS